MISFVIAAALTTAPEMNANIFKRRHHAAPADCASCAPAPCGDSPCAGAPAADAPKGDPAKSMPKGDAPKGEAPKDTPKVDAPKSEIPKTDAPKVDAPKGDKVDVKKSAAVIEIPKDLQDAIEKSPQKAAIMDYLNNPAATREARVQFLESTRQTLLATETKK